MNFLNIISRVAQANLCSNSLEVIWQRQTYSDDMEVTVRRLNKANDVSRVFFASVSK
jgi:hypothetical protein